MKTDATVLAAALAYAVRWEIFPANIAGKNKKSFKSKKFSKGRNWAKTKDPEEIKRDFKRWPKAIGIPTGADNGIFVVEADTKKGHDVDGIGSLRKLEADHGALPETLRAESPSGSVHYYFNWPADVNIINSTSKIAPGGILQRRYLYSLTAPNRSDANREVELSDRQRQLDLRAKALDKKEALLARREADLRAPSEPAPRRDDYETSERQLTEAQISEAAAMIIRAGQRRRGELPDDDAELANIHPTARAIVLAGRRRRGEIPDPPSIPPGLAGEIVRAGMKRRGELTEDREPLTETEIIAAKIIEAGKKRR
jgi:hypothetical protein